MTLQPEPKTNELIRKINNLLDQKEVSPFVLNGLKNDAERLANVDEVGSYIVWGAIAVINKDLEEARKHHLAAIHLLYTHQTLENYHSCLERFGLFEESYEWACKAYELNRGSRSLVDSLIGSSLQAGMISESISNLQEWDKLFPDEKHKFTQDIINAQKLLIKKEVDESILMEMIKTAMELLTQRGFLSRGAWIDNEDEINYAFQVNSSAEEIISLNEELSSVFVNREIIPKYSCLITIAFIPAR